MEYIKAKKWNGKGLEGVWNVSFKFDGVRCLYHEGKFVSRANKELVGVASNLSEEQLALIRKHGDVEIFAKDWNNSISVCKKKNLDTTGLHPSVIILTAGGEDIDSPSSKYIQCLADEAISLGYEGIVLKQEDTWIKVKKEYTADIRVTGILAGCGKHEGKLGAFITNYGNVGTGLSDAQRALYNCPSFVGEVIEVKYMERTKAGKLRMPVFLRHRDDKDEENIE